MAVVWPQSSGQMPAADSETREQAVSVDGESDEWTDVSEMLVAQNLGSDMRVFAEQFIPIF